MPPHPETLLISSVIRTGDYVTPVSNGVNQDLFHLHDEEWKWIERYTTKYRKVPSKQAFKSKFQDFTLYKADDVEHFIEEVKKEHARWVLVETLDRTAELLQGDEVEKALKFITSGMQDLSHALEGYGAEVDIIEHWQDSYQEASKRVASVGQHGLSGIATGFPTLDMLTGGPGPGDLWIVAARLGNGKTWTLVRMACAAVFAGHTVQYDSLEQSKSQIAMRAHAFMSSEYGKEVFRSLDLMKGKNYDLRQYKKFLRDLKNHVSGAFFVSDQSRGKVTASSIAAQIERNKPSIVFIDYLTLMESGGDDWRGVAKLSADLKLVAQRYQIPIVSAAQVNRAGEGKEPPSAATLSQSDAIGMDADCIVTGKLQSPHVMKMRLAKYRHGMDGQTWYCEFAPNTGKFVEISGDRAQEIIEQDREED